MEYLRRISLANLPKLLKCFSWLQSGGCTKVLEFTLRVNMTLGDFAVSVIMFTFQCAVNNGVWKHDIFNPSFELAQTLHYSRTESEVGSFCLF